MRWKMRSRRMPALLMTPSILPKFSTAALTMRSAPAGSATLSPLATALPPAALISSTTFCAGVVLPPPSPSTAPPRSFTTTAAPSLAASSAISRPMPPPAPVTSTTLSFNWLGISCSLSRLEIQFRSLRPCAQQACGNAEPDSLPGRFFGAFRAEIAAQAAAEGQLFLRARHAGIIMTECAADLVERNVGEDAAIGEIFHVAPAGEIERVIDRIGDAVPFQWFKPEALGQLPVEGGRGLDPAAVEPDLGVAVIIEGVAAHQVREPLGGHVIADVGIAHARRDADGAAKRGHQSRLVHAVTVPRGQCGAGAIGLALHRRVVGVVAQAVADGVVEPQGPFTVTGTVTALSRHLPCMGRDFGML